jgi:hypothetical protein
LQDLRDIQAWFLENFKGYQRMVFAGFLDMSKHGFWRILRDIQAWFLAVFKEYPRMVFGGF